MNSQNVATVKEALAVCKSGFISAAGFSAVINLLMLVPPLYMLQVYDRVIASGSVPTLVALSVLMVFLLGTMGILEWVRSQVLVRLSTRFDQLLSSRVYSISFRQALYSGGRNTNAQPLSDLIGIRQFLTGNGLFAFFDAPWLPLYLAVMFYLHPWFGWMGVGAAIVLIIIALVNERVTAKPLNGANAKMSEITATNALSLRNAEVAHAMGMQGALESRWDQRHKGMLGLQAHASQWAGFFQAFSKTFRVIIQSAILGLGAYLAVLQELTPGLMIAGSILLGRALAPVDQIVGVSKQFVAARAQYQRLATLLEKVPKDSDPMDLPAPKGFLQLENVSITPPGQLKPVTQMGTLNIPKNAAVAVVGPSASGKSTFVRGLLGIWPLAAGHVRLDGADIHQLKREDLGPYIGYLPQDIEMFEGTVAENIARFEQVDSEAVVEAAQMAGVHDMILHLAQGYDTDLAKTSLSAGQKQRLGLARALYRTPPLVVMDEPNSNLDEVGEQCLAEAVTQLKAKGSTVLIVSHRKSILSVVDHMLVMAEGRLKMFGPRDQVLEKLSAARPSNVTPIPTVPVQKS